jgi:hypothetical protein
MPASPSQIAKKKLSHRVRQLPVLHDVEYISLVTCSTTKRLCCGNTLLWRIEVGVASIASDR